MVPSLIRRYAATVRAGIPSRTRCRECGQELPGPGGEFCSTGCVERWESTTAW